MGPSKNKDPLQPTAATSTTFQKIFFDNIMQYERYFGSTGLDTMKILAAWYSGVIFAH